MISYYVAALFAAKMCFKRTVLLFAMPGQHYVYGKL